MIRFLKDRLRRLLDSPDARELVLRIVDLVFDDDDDTLSQRRPEASAPAAGESAGQRPGPGGAVPQPQPHRGPR